MPSPASITIKRGDTYSQGGSWTNDDDGSAHNLSGYTARAQLRDAADEIVGELTVTIDAGDDGTFEISATAEETEALPVGSYACDLEFTSAGGEVYSSPTFVVRVVADVTRDA